MIRQLIQDHYDGFAKLGHSMGGYKAVLEKGRTFKRAAPSRNIPAQYTKQKQCFYNAAHVVMLNRDLTYVEGFYCRNELPIPMPHAWTVNAAGSIVDPTADVCDHAYMGILVPDVWQWLATSEYYGLFDCTSFIESLGFPPCQWRT